MGHLGVDERVILKWIFKQVTYEIVGRIYVTHARFRWSIVVTMACCEIVQRILEVLREVRVVQYVPQFIRFAEYY